MIKKIFLGTLGFLALAFISSQAHADVPVYSANGFVCGKEGVTVTCKGPIPGSKDSITATGHNLVYVTINSHQEGVPTRYTYFSDTGCMIGYTFNAAGQPIAAVANHRSGAKETFDFGDGKYEKVIQFCIEGKTTASATKK